MAVKIKGNRAGLAESTDWFSENFHLTKHVRHIEFWVPVWADKSPNYQKNRFPDAPVSLLAIPALTPCHNLESDVLNSIPEGIYHPFHPFPPSRSANNTDHGHSGFTYPFSSGSTAATLSEIFSHIACFFSQAQIFTLEGGHCKKSHMIRQFPTTLFPARDRRLDVLPNVRTFVMRGAWNIMRDYPHWTVIQKALPQVQEWHCGYAKPRPEAYITLNSILSNFPTRLRRVDISLDGFYCKDGVEGNGILGSSPLLSPPIHHLCERLGRIASQLESLRFTGRICECFFRTATEVARSSKVVSPLHTIDIIVKSCCRLVVVNKQPAEPQTDGNSNDNTGDPTTTTTAQDSQSTITAPIPPPPTTQVLVPSSSPSDSVSGITNMTFIRTFERLILSAIKSLDYDLGLPQLSNIRIRYIDLDSTRPLLNPYFVFSGPDGGRCEGLWNEEIVEALGRVRPGCRGWEGCEEGMGMEVEVDAEGSGKNQSSDFVPRVFSPGFGGGIGRRKPRAIKGSAYRDLADGR